MRLNFVLIAFLTSAVGGNVSAQTIETACNPNLGGYVNGYKCSSTVNQGYNPNAYQQGYQQGQSAVNDAFAAYARRKQQQQIEADNQRRNADTQHLRQLVANALKAGDCDKALGYTLDAGDFEMASQVKKFCEK